MALYDANGQIRLTAVTGSALTGLYAADGSYNIVINDGSTLKGLYHPCGAYNAVIYSSGPMGFYAPNGSIYITNNTAGTGYTIGPLGGAVSVTDTDALAIIAAMTTPPSSSRALAIQATVVALKAKGLWTLLDALYILAAHDAQAARVNWKTPSSVATAVSSPTFTTDQGYTGNGTSSYLDTGVKSTAVGSVGTQNSNHIGVFCLNNVASNSAVGNANQSIQPRNPADNHMWGRAGNTLNTDIGLAGSSIGHFINNRVDASNMIGYINGALLNTVAQASTGLDGTNNVFICARSPGNFGTYLISAAHWGAGLTAQNCADLYDILNGARG